MKKVISVVGYVLGGAAFLYLGILELIWVYAHWGGLGLFVAIFLLPTVPIFPFVAWFVDGFFPWWYITIWAIAIGLMIIGGLCSNHDD